MRAPSRLSRLIRRSCKRGRDGENGFVLVWMALTLTLLIAMAGFAVDFWSWNREGRASRRPPDAAALGAAVFMPNNFATAVTTAKALTAKNGYTDGQNGVTVSVTQGDLPTQVKVTINKSVKNMFGESRRRQDDDDRQARHRGVRGARQHGQPDQPVRQRPDPGQHHARQHHLSRHVGQRVRPVVQQGQGRRDPGQAVPGQHGQLLGEQHRLRRRRVLLRGRGAGRQQRHAELPGLRPRVRARRRQLR